MQQYLSVRSITLTHYRVVNVINGIEQSTPFIILKISESAYELHCNSKFIYTFGSINQALSAVQQMGV